MTKSKQAKTLKYAYDDYVQSATLAVGTYSNIIGDCPDEDSSHTLEALYAKFSSMWQAQSKDAVATVAAFRVARALWKHTDEAKAKLKLLESAERFVREQDVVLPARLGLSLRSEIDRLKAAK